MALVCCACLGLVWPQAAQAGLAVHFDSLRHDVISLSNHSRVFDSVEVRVLESYRYLCLDSLHHTPPNCLLACMWAAAGAAARLNRPESPGPGLRKQSARVPT